LNRIYWDLRHQPVAASAGPFVLPGEYHVTLNVEGREVGSRSLRVTGDSLTTITDAERKLQHDTALDLHRLQSTSLEAATAVTTASAQLRALQDEAKRITNASATITTSVDALADRLSRLNVQFGIGRAQGNVPGAPSIGTQITNLKNQIMGCSGARRSCRVVQTGGRIERSDCDRNTCAL